MEQRTELLRANDHDGLKALEKACLAQNAQHKDWHCTEEMMAKTHNGEALYMHCLPADISGVSCTKKVKSPKPSFGKFTHCDLQRSELEAVYHRLNDPLPQICQTWRAAGTTAQRSAKTHQITSPAGLRASPTTS